MKIEMYRGKDKLYYWRLKAANGEVIADGSEGYASRRNVNRAVALMRSLMPSVCLVSRDWVK